MVVKPISCSHGLIGLIDLMKGHSWVSIEWDQEGKNPVASALIQIVNGEELELNIGRGHDIRQWKQSDYSNQ